MHVRRFFPMTFAALATATAPAAAEDARAIVERSIERRQLENAFQTLTMTIDEIGKDGGVKAGPPRTMESRVREEQGSTYSYVRFSAPADMAGVQFVSITPPKGDTEQFMYYPPPDELFTRISGSGRQGRFFGSDFSFEDMESTDAGKASHTLLGEETLTIAGQAVACWKIESLPTAEAATQYGKLVSWVDRSNDMPRRVLFYDKKGRELKRMTVEKVVKDGDVWIPTETLMEGLQRATRTRLVVTKWRVNVPDAELPLDVFTETYLRSHS